MAARRKPEDVKDNAEGVAEPTPADFQVDDYRKPTAKKISSVTSYGIGI
jgi:hypothetical protein